MNSRGFRMNADKINENAEHLVNEYKTVCLRENIKLMRTYKVSLNNGDFKTLNEAASALEGSSEETLLKVCAGEYEENVVFKCSNLTIEGEDTDMVLIRGANYARMKDADGTELGTFRTAVVRTDGENITLRNLNIENTAGIGFKIGRR